MHELTDRSTTNHSGYVPEKIEEGRIDKTSENCMRVGKKKEEQEKGKQIIYEKQKTEQNERAK